MVSVVIPCYRSEKTIAKVVGMTRHELASLGYKTQFVLVNDCSPDNTFQAIEGLCLNEDVIGVDLAKNFGQHSAILCGLSHVQGDLVLLMDDDLQTHPSQIKTLMRALEESDADVVFARYPKREEALWRQLGSAFWRWTMRVMTGCPKDIELTSFVLMRGWVAQRISEYDGPFPVLQGLVFQVTSHVINADVEHFEREVGSSGYTLKSLVRLWSNALNFSMLPLRVATATGAAMGIIGVVAALVLIVRKIIHPDIPVGWSSIMVTLLTCSGILLVAMGIVGEYVGRIFMTSNKSPQYVERKTLPSKDNS